MMNSVLQYHHEATRYQLTQALIDSGTTTLTQAGFKTLQHIGKQLAEWESEREAAGGKIPTLLTY